MIKRGSFKRLGLLCLIFILWSTVDAREINNNTLAAEQLNHDQAFNKTQLKIGLIVFPPTAYNTSEGNCIGTGVDAIKSIFTPDEYELSIYCATPARVYRDFLNGSIDLTVNVKSTKSLSQNVYFSDKPHIILKVMLYTKDLLAKGKISSIKQFNYHGAKQQFIDQGYKMVTQANSKEAMAVFLRGGTQGLISYQLPYLFYKESLQVLFEADPANKDIIETELLQVPSYFVVNSTNPNAQAIMAHINQNNR